MPNNIQCNNYINKMLIQITIIDKINIGMDKKKQKKTASYYRYTDAILLNKKILTFQIISYNECLLKRFNHNY